MNTPADRTPSGSPDRDPSKPPATPGHAPGRPDPTRPDPTRQDPTPLDPAAQDASNFSNPDHAPLAPKRAKRLADAAARSRAALAQADVPNLPARSEHVAALIHELNNLLEGSLRCVSLARDSMQAASSGTAPSASALAPALVLDAPALHAIQRQLDAAAIAMDRMSMLLHAAMQGPQLALGSALLAATRPVTISEAIDHAAEVLRPLAHEQGTTLNTQVGIDAAHLPAGSLYTVVLNALKNALESIARVGGQGCVHILCDLDRTVAPGSPRNIRLEIADDGEGPPPGFDASRAFEFGFSTKQGNAGIGLALARSIVQQAGGTIALLRRPPHKDFRKDARRPGALLRALIPYHPPGLPAPDEHNTPDTNPRGNQ